MSSTKDPKAGAEDPKAEPGASWKADEKHTLPKNRLPIVRQNRQVSLVFLLIETGLFRFNGDGLLGRSRPSVSPTLSPIFFSIKNFRRLSLLPYRPLLTIWVVARTIVGSAGKSPNFAGSSIRNYLPLFKFISSSSSYVCIGPKLLNPGLFLTLYQVYLLSMESCQT